MASIFRKPGSNFFYAAFTDPHGRRVQRSTKQRNRADALELAREWQKIADRGRAGTLTEAQARRVVSDILESVTKERLQFFTTRAWCAEWLAGKRGTVAAKSIEKYEQVTDDFLAHIGERADLTIAAITPKDVRSFRDALAKGGRAPGTVNQLVRKVLSAPFLAAQRLGYIPTNPCAAIDALASDAEESREPFTAEQIAALLAAAPDEEWRGMILAGYFTGLRLRDITELCWETIDFAAGVIRLQPKKSRRRVAQQTLPLHERLATWLRTRPRGIGKARIFPTLASIGTGGRHGLSGRFKTIMETAGIKGRVKLATGQGRTTSSLSFHSLRHTFNSDLANAGVPAELRKKLTGHTDDASHARYTHHDVETMRSAVSKLTCAF